jgi:hypothetical protein
VVIAPLLQSERFPRVCPSGALVRERLIDHAKAQPFALVHLRAPFPLRSRDPCLDHSSYVIVEIVMLEDLDKLRVRQEPGRGFNMR